MYSLYRKISYRYSFHCNIFCKLQIGVVQDDLAIQCSSVMMQQNIVMEQLIVQILVMKLIVGFVKRIQCSVVQILHNAIILWCMYVISKYISVHKLIFVIISGENFLVHCKILKLFSYNYNSFTSYLYLLNFYKA